MAEVDSKERADGVSNKNLASSCAEAGDTVAKQTQEGTYGSQLQAGDKAGPRNLIGTSTNLKSEQSKKPHDDSQMNRPEKPYYKTPAHDSNRRVHYEHTQEDGSSRKAEGMEDPRSRTGKGKAKGSDKHASNNRKVHLSSVSGSQGGPGPVHMGQVSPGRHKGRKARGRGQPLGVSRVSKQ